MIPRTLKVAVIVMVTAVIVMAFYLRTLKRRAESTQEHSADLRPVAAPVTGRPERVALFVADDDTGTLHREDVDIVLPAEHSEREREILRALVARYQQQDSRHPLPGGADVKDVYLVNDGTAVIDVNSPFAEAHRSGVLVEELTITSMIQTLVTSLPSVTRVKFLVDGSERETLAGHADLSGFYDVSAVTALASEFQAGANP